jgi:hypothetical protein
MMKTPFKNDIFSMIWIAFKNIFPDKECECFWEPNIRDCDDGTPCLGVTDFDEESGEVTVFIKPELSVQDAAEIFAHELAHVAVGKENEHNEIWEKAFDDIFDEYNRIGDEMFNRHDAIPVTDGKAYRKEDK